MPAALLAIAAVFALAWADEPNVEVLSARFDREKSPVWADGDTATFFYRGEAERVEVIAGGDFKSLTRIPSSNAWTVAVKLPDLERAVISYYFTVTKNGSRQNSTTRLEGVWRGPKAPEPAAETAELRGSLKTLEIESNALGMRRKLTVYLPQGFEPAKPHRVIYAADGEGTERFARVLEPLIVTSKLPPIVMVGAHGGGYEGVRPTSRITTRRKTSGHKSTFRESTPSGLRNTKSSSALKSPAGPNVNTRSLATRTTGCFSDAQTAAVSCLSWRCGIPIDLGWSWLFPYRAAARSHCPKGCGRKRGFSLEAGTWEQSFQEYTSRLSRAIEDAGVAVQFRSRVGGHDEAIWREEFARGLLSAFGTR